MSWAKHLFDERNTRAHLSLSQTDCERSVGNLRPLGRGRMCLAEWDGLLCWPPTLAGASIKQPCPALRNLDPTQHAFKLCLPNATWFRSTDYSRCLTQAAGDLPDLDLLRDQASGWDDDLTSPAAQEVNSTAQALWTSTTQRLGEDAATLADFAAADDLAAAVAHGLSVLCLLSACITWLALRLSDRLATRRYVVLVATLLVALLFHLIILISRCQSLLLTWPSPDSGEHHSANATSSGQAFVSTAPRVQHATSRAAMKGYGHGDTAVAADGIANSAGDGYIVSRTTMGASSAGEQPMLTLCQVGRVLFHLADLSVYSFTFAVSLYYTMVILGKKLTLNKLITLFLLALGLPAICVVFSILLYIFLPLGGAAAFPCAIHALQDEFHWATSGPKLLCVVLSLCLMTVCAYSFLRLHFPALHTSSETFYARQGVFKLLLFLVFASAVELLFLVHQYQHMYDLRPPAPPLALSSTVLSGVKGSLLALLLCFLDVEVLHGTCCPTSDNVRESTVVLGERNSQERGSEEMPAQIREKKLTELSSVEKQRAAEVNAIGCPGQGDSV